MYGITIIKLKKCSWFENFTNSMQLWTEIESAIIIDYPTSNPFTPAYILIAFD